MLQTAKRILRALLTGTPVQALVLELYGFQLWLKAPRWPLGLRWRGVRALRRGSDGVFTVVLTLLARMAEVDGRVCPEEIQALDDFLGGCLRLDTGCRVKALELFREVRSSGESYDAALQRFAGVSGMRRSAHYCLIDSLLVMAYADQQLVPAEERLVRKALQTFGLQDADLQSIIRRHADLEQLRRREAQLRRRLYRAWAAASGHGAARPRAAGQERLAEEFEKCYRVLGCSRSDTRQQIKSRYRELVLKHHPDRLAGRGVSDEFRELSAARFREIQEAYEFIKNERSYS